MCPGSPVRSYPRREESVREHRWAPKPGTPHPTRHLPRALDQVHSCTYKGRGPLTLDLGPLDVPPVHAPTVGTAGRPGFRTPVAVDALVRGRVVSQPGLGRDTEGDTHAHTHAATGALMGPPSTSSHVAADPTVLPRTTPCHPTSPLTTPYHPVPPHVTPYHPVPPHTTTTNPLATVGKSFGSTWYDRTRSHHVQHSRQSYVRGTGVPTFTTVSGSLSVVSDQTTRRDV